MSAAAGVRTDGLGVQVSGRIVLDAIDVAVPAGRVTGLVGPNGAGKSTLLRAVAGVDRPAHGAVLLDDADLTRMRRRRRAQRVALVEQSASTDLPLTVEAVVALSRTPHLGMWAAESDADRQAVREALIAVDMPEFAGRDFTRLSGGERQRVHIARALAQQPDLLLLDEPTNNLDVHAQLATMRLLQGLAAQGMTVLTSLHDLNLAMAFCDEVIVVADGGVAAAGPTVPVLTEELIQRVYGVRATLLWDAGAARPVIAFS